ncbi:arginase family protein [Candidatus Woesearchaeota archaeon]|nr:arginase family protein [Candidatus Woesearchaeota archaeon]
MIIKIPYSDYNKANEAPDKILEAFEQIWSNEDETDKKIDVKESSDYSEKTIALGGSHVISYDCIKKFAKKNKNPGLIVFDAHPDVFQEFETVSYQDWVKHIVDENIIAKENIILIGIRNPSVEEIQYLKENNIKYYTCRQIFNNLQEICDAVMELARNFSALYISVDIDSVDPAFAPGVSHIEPAGLSSRELIYFLQRIKRIGNLKAADIVEVVPSKDINGMTVKLAAKIMKELI